ncbi:hypothetical protein IQ241_07570 [Romeria aff. gracilis LEGE 07310]|uniref:Uncharacterized protein n=1 Tax=Vasconcelosia minhoensis LEGE 07310 TaxID=915328 RepID=A0A8J7AAG5_9CYAN|nr:hypothetical protein [Romeria gracilis]MBE9077156.1 hypothetical protein [Romeria aff. gracilis LEGE 07310]
MTNSSEDRLSRIEALVESNARSIQALSESNSESIQSLGDQIADLIQVQRDAESERAELRAATLGIANLLSALDDDRPTILRRLNSIEHKVDRLLEE